MKFQGKKVCLLLILLALFWLFSTGVASARDLVSGKYISSTGTTIVLELNITKPPPANLIVHQFFPAGVNMVNSRPQAMKYDRKKGKAKWLIKKVRSGKMQFIMELSEPIGPGSVRAEVRCRDRKTGEMTDIVVTP